MDVHSFQLPSRRGKAVELPAMIDIVGEDVWEKSLCKTDVPIVIDVFSGAGGMSLGFEMAGYRVAASVDSDSWSCRTHAANILSKSACQDVSLIEDPFSLLKAFKIPEVHVVIGGPPCQGFSRVGRGKIRSLIRKASLSPGDDPRNRLCFEFARFVRTIRPLAFVMENVPDIWKYGDGEYINNLIVLFEDLGYQVYTDVLKGTDFGVPQTRSRFFMVGLRTGREFTWPKATLDRQITVRDAIHDLPPAVSDGSEGTVRYTSVPATEFQRYARAEMNGPLSEIVFDHVTRPVRSDDRQIFRLMKPGDTYLQVPPELRRYRSDIFDDKYTKLRWDKPSWTITAHLAKDGYRYIHPDGRQARTISVREAARLQSFPDHYRFSLL